MWQSWSLLKLGQPWVVCGFNDWGTTIVFSASAWDDVNNARQVDHKSGTSPDGSFHWLAFDGWSATGPAF